MYADSLFTGDTPWNTTMQINKDIQLGLSTFLYRSWYILLDQVDKPLVFDIIRCVPCLLKMVYDTNYLIVDKN